MRATPFRQATAEAISPMAELTARTFRMAAPFAHASPTAGYYTEAATVAAQPTNPVVATTATTNTAPTSLGTISATPVETA